MVGLVRVEGSPLVIVEAGELIQSVIYPELSLDTISELNLEEGTYSVTCEMKGDNKIHVSLSQTMNQQEGLIVFDLSSRLKL